MSFYVYDIIFLSDRGSVEAFSLVSDMNYVAQNAARIIRGLFEVALKKAWPTAANRCLHVATVLEQRQKFAHQAGRDCLNCLTMPFHFVSRLLTLSKMVDKRIWGHESPLRQFPILSFESLKKIEDKKLNIDKLREMEAKEIGRFLGAI